MGCLLGHEGRRQGECVGREGFGMLRILVEPSVYKYEAR